MENDLIRRSDVLNSEVFMCGGNPCEPYFDGYSTALDKVEDVVKAIPAVDAVEGVVRCRDCVHYYDVLRQGTQFESGSCDRWFDGTAFSPDDYCSRGQRREDGDA